MEAAEVEAEAEAEARVEEEALLLLLHLQAPQENPWQGIIVVALENRPHLSSRLKRGIQTPGSVKHPTPPALETPPSTCC